MAAAIWWPTASMRPPQPYVAANDQVKTTDIAMVGSTAVASRRQPGANPSGGASRGMNFDSISGVSGIERAARTSGVDRPEVLEYLQGAIAYCEAVESHARHPSKAEASGQLPPEVKQSLAYSRDFAKTFCDSPAMNSDAIAREMLGLESTGDILQSQFLDSIPENEAKTVGVAAAQRLLLEAKSVAAMTRAAHYLLAHEQLPQTEKLPIPASMDATAVQLLALDMFACNTRGGCGPNGFYTATGCGVACRPGITMADVWQDQHSPAEIRYARELAAAIQADRAAAAGAQP